MNKKEIAVVASCNTKFVPHLAALLVLLQSFPKNLF